MAFLKHYILAILLILLPIAIKGDGFPNPFDGSGGNICDDVQCGRGSCESSTSYPYNFRCNCEDGWRRTRLDDENDFQFLPCIIPNCTLNYSCMPAAAPAPPVPNNMSFFDPCYWIYCGEGTCARNTSHTHTCQCSPGYSNLLNITAFPCYNDCAINSDTCQRLGIRSATSNSTQSTNYHNNTSQAITLFTMKFNWMVVLLAIFIIGYDK